MVRSRLIVGAPGSGKSQMILHSVTDLICTGKICVIVADPHGQLAFDLMLQLESKGRLWRVLYDALGDFVKVLGGAISPKQSVAENPWIRKQENLAQIMGYADLFWTAGQREDTGKLLDHPMTFSWLVNALALILYQPAQTSLLMLRYCFMPGTPQFDFLLQSCTDPETAYQWLRIKSLHGTRSYRELEAQLGGAFRLVKTVLDLPEFAARLSGNFNLEKAAEEKKVIILNGASAIPAARTAIFRGTSLAMSAMLRRRFAITGKPLPILMVIDEAPATHAIGPAEIDFVREGRKLVGDEIGGGLWIAGQDLSFVDDQIKHAIKSSTREHFWGRLMDDELTLEAARDIGYATLDRNEIWHHVTKFRPRLYEVPRISTTKTKKGESVSEGTQFINVPEEFMEPVFRSPTDQLLDVAAILQNLKPGEFLVRTPEGVSRTPVYFPLVEDPYPDAIFPDLARKKFERAVSETQNKPEFSTPAGIDQWPSTTTSSPKSETAAETNFSTFIPLPPKSSSKPASTRPPRKRGKGSNGGKGKDS